MLTLASFGAKAADKINVQVPLQSYAALSPNASKLQFLGGLKAGMKPAEVEQFLTGQGYKLSESAQSRIVTCSDVERGVNLIGNEFLGFQMYEKSTDAYNEMIKINYTSEVFGNGLGYFTISRGYRQGGQPEFKSVLDEFVSSYGKYAEGKEYGWGVFTKWYWKQNEPVDNSSKESAYLEVRFKGKDGKLNGLEATFSDSSATTRERNAQYAMRDAICKLGEKAMKDAGPKDLQLPQ